MGIFLALPEGAGIELRTFCMQITCSIIELEAPLPEQPNKNGGGWMFKNHLFIDIVFHLLGDYGSAIETLVTAISLIKQSKVSADDRCKVLISSLQDCLHGIESKSYGSGSR